MSASSSLIAEVPSVVPALGPLPVRKALPDDLSAELAEYARHLKSDWSLVDGTTGDVLSKSRLQPGGDWMIRGVLCREVAARREPTIIEDHDLLVVLAVPVVEMVVPEGAGRCAKRQSRYHVGLSQFLTRPANREEDHRQLAAVLGITQQEARTWAARQTPRGVEWLLSAAGLVADKLSALRQAAGLREELDAVAENLSSSYEELSLLYRLTENLRVSGGAERLARLAMQWLMEVIPAKGFAIRLAVEISPEADSTLEVPRAQFVHEGECPLDQGQFQQLACNLKLAELKQPLVVNHAVASGDPRKYLGIEQLVVVPLVAGERRLGWLAAFNHREGREFGTEEAGLLSSVAAILGIHTGNVELYREQTDLLSGVVRALSSAIDAKDPYTRGHSDRVARVSVRLARQMGLPLEMQNTIYLSGLLHDIGKIGIQDEVLRKPGGLTEAEYEHIKRHPEIGYKILVGLKKFDNVLPGVLHHHEAWDGGGYPHGLKGERIPLMARIIAVADALDAMGSDRPYRQGMDEEKLDRILREGAGRQWDAVVVDAFFAVRDDIREIARHDRDSFPLDLHLWA